MPDHHTARANTARPGTAGNCQAIGSASKSPLSIHNDSRTAQDELFPLTVRLWVFRLMWTLLALLFIALGVMIVAYLRVRSG
jgi:hypothetical protein